MNASSIPALLGTLLLGVLLGLLAYREILNWVRRTTRYEIRQGSCTICSATGFVSPCSRCKKAVAMCHSYFLRLTGDPDPTRITGRPTSWVLCTECSSGEEKRFLEAKGKVVFHSGAEVR